MSDNGSAPSSTAGATPTVAEAELLPALIHGIAKLGKLGPLRRARAVEHLLPPSLRIAATTWPTASPPRAATTIRTTAAATGDN